MKKLFSLFLAFFAFTTWARAQAPEGADVNLVLTHVTVINPASGAVRADMNIIVEYDRIVAVAKKVSGKALKDTKTIDARGKFLIPGLWDMHVHTFFGNWVPGGREATLPLFIANGVTGIRDMGSDLDPVLLARKETADHSLLGPRMIVAGPMLDGPNTKFPASIAVATPEDGRRAVDNLKARGVDFIKIQSGVPRDAYFAIAAESKKQDLTFVGHVPDAVRVSEASNAGQKSFEHLIGIFEGSSTAEDTFLKGPKSPGRFLETYNAAQESALIQLLAKNQTWQCPTLFWERGQWLVDTLDVAADVDARYAPLSWREGSWPKFKADILKELDTDPLPVRQKFVIHELEIVRRLRQAGVLFLAGTDTPAGVDVLPGFSLHLELQRFVAAGFTPLEALQTATINPAKFFGKEQDFGAVEPGKIADLVLLDANPLEDIANTQKISAVVVAGRYLSRADLDAKLKNVAAYSASH